jgi:hypothetical protein
MDPFIEHPDRFPGFHDSLFSIYPLRLDERLPEIAMPLLQGDPEIPIDLQSVLDRAYDAGPYRREVAYREEMPFPPLSSEWTAWAGEVLKRV